MRVAAMIMHKRPYGLLVLCGILLLLLLMARASAAAKEPPGWWGQAEMEASQYGYKLLSVHDMETLLNSDSPMLLLDVRPDYEYKTKHLPNAVNLEFHLGDRSKLSPEKEKALRKILGPDLERKVVIYCRSYQ